MRFFRKKKHGAKTSQSGPFIQPKLSVGKAGDKYEQEADHMASKVVDQQTSSIQKKGAAEEEQVQQKSLAESTTKVQKKDLKEEEPVQKQEKAEEEEVQAKSAEEEEAVQKQEGEEEELQTKGEEEEEAVQAKGEEEEESLQAKAASTNVKRPNKVEHKLHQSKGAGQTMTQEAKHKMELGFGADFSKVKIHTDQSAIEMNKALGAHAFTNGNDIYFNTGKYDPNSKSGQLLLAHELTHTLQQQGAVKKKIQRKVKISGTDEKTREKFLGKINDGTPVKFKLDSQQLEPENKDAKGTDTFTKKMLGAIKAAQNVDLKLITENDQVFIDSFNSGKVDTADMFGLSSNIFKSWLLHFVIERFAIADYDKKKSTATNEDFKKAHETGHEAQEAFLKELYPKKTIKYKSEGFDETTKKVDKNKDGTIDYIFDFTDVKYVFTQPIKNGKTLENITKAELKEVK
ncbi:DUF4157 domain-containing protein [Echinicola sp. 20G]|uniref:eCIS core domain-containing protein n=1 Tax=Echinicola sp. 20G TaxID=2781961 RepID=UPI001911045E|nr:DUF4157 domain-containing protein [Echinicola sp. 20G]